MKNRIILLLASAVCMVFAGCGDKKAGEQNGTLGGEILDDTAITIFAEQSFDGMLEEVTEAYAKLRPTVAISSRFDSMEGLKGQIEDGVSCDVLFGAEEDVVNDLEEQGLLVEDYRCELTDGYLAAQAANGQADEQMRNAAADFILFLESDQAVEICQKYEFDD